MKKCVMFLAVAALFFPMQVMAQDAADGWVKIFNGKDLEGWKANDTEGKFFVNEEGEIAGEGGRCHLFYMEELQEFELKIDVYINDGGNSGVYVLSPWVDNNWPTGGYELQVNSTHKDPVKTGSIYELIKVYESPAAADEWFTYHIIVKGNEMTVKVDDKVLYTYCDPVARFAKNPDVKKDFKYVGQKGHIALQQHDPGSKPKFKNIYIKKL